MPATSATLCGSRPSLTKALCNAAKTAKSPQPGHHHDLASVLKSASVGMLQFLLGPGHNLAGQERLAVVLYEACNVGHTAAGSASRQHVAYVQLNQLLQLSAEVVLHDQHVLGTLNQVGQLLGRERSEHPYLRMGGLNTRG